MEPISTAMAAFSVVSAGVKAGKDIASLAKPLGKLFDGIDEAKKDHSNKRNSAFNMTANEEALTTFVAKKQAEDLENNLREIVISTRGISAWQELLKLRADIKRERKEAERNAKILRDERNELILLMVFVVGLPLAALLTVSYFLFIAR